MALLALYIQMFSIQLVPLVLRRLVFKEGGLPTIYRMTRLAGLTGELSLVVILMAVAGFTVLVIQGLEPPLGMALFTLGLYMLPFQLVSLVLRRLVLKEGWPPTIHIVT